MRSSFLLTAAIGIVLAGTARADIAVGTVAPDIEAKEWLNSEQAISLPEMKGMVVVLFFWVSFHSGGQSMMTLINLVENSPGFGKPRGVFVVGLTEADRKRTESVLKEEKAFFPVGVESSSPKDYGISSFPRVVIIDPEGKVAWTGWPGQADEMVKALTDVLAKTPPTRTHPELAAKCHLKLDEARVAVRKEQYRDAFVAAREAYESAVTGDPLKTLCQDMLDLIEALGRDRAAEVDRLLDDKKFAEAVKNLRFVSRHFRGMEISRTAKKRIAGLKSEYSEIAEIVGSQEKEAQAAGLLVQARDEIRARRFGRGYVTLERVIEDYAGTEPAEYAQGVLSRLEENATIMSAVRDHKAAGDCENWLALARTFRQSGKFRQAKTYYQKILDKYSKTKYAAIAAKELVNVP